MGRDWSGRYRGLAGVDAYRLARHPRPNDVGTRNLPAVAVACRSDSTLQQVVSDAATPPPPPGGVCTTLTLSCRTAFPSLSMTRYVSFLRAAARAIRRKPEFASLAISLSPRRV